MQETHAANKVICLDFEASALGFGSYPIEVAVADVHTGDGKSWLILPTQNWMLSGRWLEDSARIHNISRELLLREGVLAPQVMRELTEFVGAAPVYSDNPKSDGEWLRALCEGAGLNQAPFQLQDFNLHAIKIGQSISDDWEPLLEKAMDLACKRYPNPHRAFPDARRNAEILRLMRL